MVQEAESAMGNTPLDPKIEQALILKFWRVFPCPPPWDALDALKQVDWSRLGDYAEAVHIDFIQRCDIVVGNGDDVFSTSEVLEPWSCSHVCRTAVIVVCSFFIVFSALAVVCFIQRRKREGCSMTEARKRGRQLSHDLRNLHIRKKKRGDATLPESSVLYNAPPHNHYASDECSTMLPAPDHNTTFSSQTSTNDSLRKIKPTSSDDSAIGDDDMVDTTIYEKIDDDAIYSDPELIRKRYTLPPPDSLRCKNRHKHRIPAISPLPKDLKVPKSSSPRSSWRPISASRAVNSDYNLVVYENTRHRFYDPPKSCTHSGLSSVVGEYLTPQETPKSSTSSNGKRESSLFNEATTMTMTSGHAQNDSSRPKSDAAIKTVTYASVNSNSDDCFDRSGKVAGCLTLGNSLYKPSVYSQAKIDTVADKFIEQPVVQYCVQRGDSVSDTVSGYTSAAKSNIGYPDRDGSTYNRYSRVGDKCITQRGSTGPVDGGVPREVKNTAQCVESDGDHGRRKWRSSSSTEVKARHNSLRDMRCKDASTGLTSRDNISINRSIRDASVGRIPSPVTDTRSRDSSVTSLVSGDSLSRDTCSRDHPSRGVISRDSYIGSAYREDPARNTRFRDNSLPHLMSGDARLRNNSTDDSRRLNNSLTDTRYRDNLRDRSIAAVRIRNSSVAHASSFVPVQNSTPVKVYHHPNGHQLFLRETTVNRDGHRGARWYAT